MSLWTLGTNMLRTLLYHTMYIGSASNGKTKTENNFQSIFFFVRNNLGARCWVKWTKLDCPIFYLLTQACFQTMCRARGLSISFTMETTYHIVIVECSENVLRLLARAVHQNFLLRIESSSASSCLGTH